MKKTIGVILGGMPFVAFAASSLQDLLVTFGGILNQLVPLLTGLAVVWLLWNIVKYIEAGAGDPKTRDAARDSIIFSIVLIFVMVSVWGLVAVVGNTLSIEKGDTAPTVKLPTVIN